MKITYTKCGDCLLSDLELTKSKLTIEEIWIIKIRIFKKLKSEKQLLWGARNE